MTYRIELRPAAVRALRSIPKPHTSRIRGAIALLAIHPKPPAARRFWTLGTHRVRAGEYRILYTAEDDVLLIVVITLSHRQGIYSGG